MNSWQIHTINDMAMLVNKGWKVGDNVMPYLGLEHIGQQTLQIVGVGNSEQVISNKKCFEKGDILFGKLRPYFRKVVMPDFDGICSTDIWVIKTKNNLLFDQDFLFFFFTNQPIIDIAIKSSTGTRMPRANWDILSSTSWKIPPIDEQKRITKCLKNIQNKISINNSIISKLEEMAKIIYEYWFLQFDFPNSEGKPYASSGGTMKYSEELGREIPIDWEVLNLWERFEFEKGIEIGAKQYLSESGKNRVLFWRVGDMNGTCSTYADEKLFGKLLLQPRDICVSFDGSVGKVDFGLVGGYSSGIRNVYDRAKKIDSSVIYQIFKSDHIQQLIHKYATGSNILHASGSITNMRIPYNEKVFEEYQKIIKPMFDKMVQAKQENQKLAQLRDWLLPMLMNGQARVE